MTTFHRAQLLRRDMTKSEWRLWNALRTLRAKGYHFRKQAPWGDFILDFVCHNYRLVVEVDGPQHDETPDIKHDAARDGILRRAGYEVVRIPSLMAFRDPGAALGIVMEVLRGREQHKPRRDRSAREDLGGI